jgi:predicted nucleotidyltransferase
MTDLILTIAKRLREQYGAKEIILYGSYAKGEETGDSDIDILVISDTKERFHERQATVKRLLRGLKNKVAVSPIVLTPSELDWRLRINDVFIKEIMDTGVRG